MRRRPIRCFRGTGRGRRLGRGLADEVAAETFLITLHRRAEMRRYLEPAKAGQKP
ncbi:hypothetical protein [Nonomuraea sp. SYSU D8015]|uniref:hypothetical protein n=1 Tax=Nonomuraea sp. SYSU D8015 TaxID=2593644 RepID=UPI001660C5A2|nr:hypothetical protein [Nonomuraea sp. SYSU D8015]